MFNLPMEEKSVISIESQKEIPKTIKKKIDFSHLGEEEEDGMRPLAESRKLLMNDETHRNMNQK